MCAHQQEFCLCYGVDECLSVWRLWRQGMYFIYCHTVSNTPTLVMGWVGLRHHSYVIGHVCSTLYLYSHSEKEGLDV